jgi:hypothetical protein
LEELLAIALDSPEQGSHAFPRCIRCLRDEAATNRFSVLASKTNTGRLSLRQVMLVPRNEIGQNANRSGLRRAIRCDAGLSPPFACRAIRFGNVVAAAGAAKVERRLHRTAYASPVAAARGKAEGANQPATRQTWPGPGNPRARPEDFRTGRKSCLTRRKWKIHSDARQPKDVLSFRAGRFAGRWEFAMTMVFATFPVRVEAP